MHVFRLLILVFGVCLTFSPFVYMPGGMNAIQGFLSPFGVGWLIFMVSPYLLFHIATRYITQRAITIVLGLSLLVSHSIWRVITYLHPSSHEGRALFFIQFILFVVLILSTTLCYSVLLCLRIAHKSKK